MQVDCPKTPFLFLYQVIDEQHRLQSSGLTCRSAGARCKLTPRNRHDNLELIIQKKQHASPAAKKEKTRLETTGIPLAYA